MLAEERLKQFQDLINTSTKDELIWINGYLNGLVGNGHANGNGHAATTNGNGHAVLTAVKKITLAFGTETGNAKKLATHLAAVAKKKGVNAKLADLSQYRVANLAKEDYFFIVISTQGEGEPPIPAKKFYDYIHENELTLDNIKFSVLALGDTSYPMFCKTGEDVDARFKKFGAKRVVDLQKCDVEYEEDALIWFEKVLSTVEAKESIAHVDTPAPVFAAKASTKKYYNGTILTNVNLNDRGSNKQTYHIEIGAEQSIEYVPGDAIGIFPKNKDDVVEKIITITGVDANTEVITNKITAAVRELLNSHLNICYLLTSTVKKYAVIIQQEIPDTRMDLVDLLRIYPVKNAEQFIDIIKILSPISPRLYSIASAPASQQTEVHIIVARNRFLAQDEQRFGLCSYFLGDQPINSQLSFYVHKNRAFRLPAPEKDIIMIGPGTGIAPMRSFLIERDASGAKGRNWLFFGEQHFITDFLYQTEIQNYVEMGVLNKLDLAFSRDQAEKIYVQHRMLEKAAELYQWINSGAFIYISGTKDPMGKDVEATLLKIISEQ
ncbi:MAG: flavodoxin domain-containing protein, partial [Chitinophagaceae bacterium]